MRLPKRLPGLLFKLTKIDSRLPEGLGSTACLFTNMYDNEFPNFQNSFQTSIILPGAGSNHTNDCGGGDGTVKVWDLTGRDAAGNTTTNHVYGGRVRVTQDDNHADLAYRAVQPTTAYAGTWATAKCICWLARSDHKTSTKNASATITVPLPFSSDADTPAAVTNRSHVGLVMHQSVGRSKFQVWVNGVLRSTVDTYSPTDQPRMMVHQTAISGPTTIKLVNLATAGRPRLDLDAVVTN